MGKQAALVTTWANSVPGREGKAIETFMDYMTLLGKRAAEGAVDEPEAYFSYDGSGGVGIVRGDSTTLLELWESDDFRDVIARGQLTVQELHTQLYAAGDSVQDMVGRFTQTAGSMGYM